MSGVLQSHRVPALGFQGEGIVEYMHILTTGGIANDLASAYNLLVFCSELMNLK